MREAHRQIETPARAGLDAFVIDRLYPALLLLASNIFMTFAWYGHLRYKSAP